MKTRRRTINTPEAAAEIGRLFFDKGLTISKIASKYDKHPSTILHHLGKNPRWGTAEEKPVPAKTNETKAKEKKRHLPESYLEYLKKDLKKRGIKIPAKQYLRKILFYTQSSND